MPQNIASVVWLAVVAIICQICQLLPAASLERGGAGRDSSQWNGLQTVCLILSEQIVKSSIMCRPIRAVAALTLDQGGCTGAPQG
jgi:hypothetical protein